MINVIYIGLLFNYLLKDDIIDWADSQIINNNNDENYIIELSFSSGKTEKEILALLNNYMTDDYNSAIEFYFSMFNKLMDEGYYDWQKVVKEIVRFYENDFIKEDTEKIFYSILVDDYYLRNDGYSGIMKMPEALYSFLSKYKIKNSNYQELPFSW